MSPIVPLAVVQDDPLVTPAAAAAYLGVSVDTLSVWRCVRRYAVPYVKIGRKVMYPMSGLRAFRESRTINPIPQVAQ